jgi:RNA polymerase sigma-70 factor (ECF subfamily)
MAIIRDPSQLMRQVAAGDLNAYGQLYDEFAPQVFGMVWRLVRNRQLAEEVTQDVFIWVWREARSFDPERGTAASWIHTVARRRAIDAVRREQSQRTKVAALLRDPHEAEAAAAWTALEDRDEVEALMAELTSLEREAIQLSYWEGLSGPELAGRLGTKLATAKSRKRDGLMRMRRASQASLST